MGIRKSTGRGSRVRHSTALEWDELMKAKKHIPPILYATGENSPLRHSTGTEFDYKVLAALMRGEGGEAITPQPNTRDNPKIHGIPEKATEDTYYLDVYLQRRVEEAKGQRNEGARGRLTTGVAEARGEFPGEGPEGRVAHPGGGSRVRGMPHDPADVTRERQRAERDAERAKKKSDASEKFGFQKLDY